LATVVFGKVEYIRIIRKLKARVRIRRSVGSLISGFTFQVSGFVFYSSK
jgi:hypothetical protein